MEILHKTINTKLRMLEKFIRRRIPFSKRKLFIMAITHSSFSGEFPDYPSNERLEFLGDTVLSLAVTHYLFSHYPFLPEGELSKKRAYIVSEKGLSEKALSLNIGDFLLFGKGEERSGGKFKKALLADALESVIAAIFIAFGFAEAEKFILRILTPELKEVRNIETTDHKTQLQEITQKKFHTTPEYTIVKETGSPRNKMFFAKVSLNETVLGWGKGSSKKEAEENAAKKALQNEIIKNDQENI
jgi:ribonuclease-3